MGHVVIWISGGLKRAKNQTWRGSGSDGCRSKNEDLKMYGWHSPASNTTGTELPVEGWLDRNNGMFYLDGQNNWWNCVLFATCFLPLFSTTVAVSSWEGAANTSSVGIVYCIVFKTLETDADNLWLQQTSHEDRFFKQSLSDSLYLPEQRRKSDEFT